MTHIDSSTSEHINIFKFILILGVVLIHSNLNPLLPAEIQTGTVACLIDFFSKASKSCVSLFFFISGFLFFVNIRKWNVGIYKKKIRSRIRTLLIPYLLWNLAAALINVYKASNPLYKDFGLIENGHFNPIVFISGFWEIDDTYPWGIAMWFIRNLMIFSAFTPLLYFLCKNKYTGCMAFIIFVLLPLPYWLVGLGWFSFGAMLGMNRYSLPSHISIKYSLPAFATWMVCTYLTMHSEHSIYFIFDALSTIGAGCFLWSMALLISRRVARRTILGILIKSTFFIYASHQLYITIVKRFYINLFGIGSGNVIMIDYIFTFITLFGLSFVFYMIMHKLFPQLTNILTGSRA